MLLKIRHKLLLAITLSVAMALLAMVVLVWMDFQRGFTGYLRSLEAAEIAELRSRLESIYTEQGSWLFLRSRPEEQERLLGLVIAPPPRRPPGRSPESRPREFGRPPGPPPEHRSRPDRREGPETRRRPSLASRLLDMGQRIAITDIEDRLIAGRPEVHRSGSRTELLAAGERIGFLHVLPLPNPSREADVAFVDTRVTNAIWIALIVLAFAGLIAWWLSRRLLRPVQRLAVATKAVAAGDYKARVEVDSGDELEGLGGDFNRMAQALEDQREQQHQWLAEISHELRTPMAVLGGEIEALVDGVRRPTSENLASLEQEIDRLKRLVEDLYTLSVADSGAVKLRPESFDLAWLIDDFCRDREGQELRIDTRLQEPAPIVADEDRLRQVLHNLLQNSERYTDSPGQVRVDLARHGAGYRLVWEDSAPGVPEDKLGRLFDPLFRLERSRDRRFGGAGLGLAIVQRLVDAHGGRIRATGSELGGLRIVIDLPAGTPDV
ncbi:MAG: ATP-binding protein [Pseudomonadota bacterium]